MLPVKGPALVRRLSSGAHGWLIAGGDSKGMRQGAAAAQVAGERRPGATRLEMTVMARVEHVGMGFERERGDKEGTRHEHSTKDRGEDRGEDRGDR